MKFRKKPVVIEARQVPARTSPVTSEAVEALTSVANWCSGYITACGVEISTLEGVMVASPGDWIIQGIQGEFYPCKPDIFAATYEPVAEVSA